MYSIIIPAYNEENRLSYTLETLHKGFSFYGQQYEIIVIDDGSTDKTCEVAKNEILIKQPRNMGKGAAITEGMKHITGDIAVILDADMPTIVKEIIELGKLTARNDIVIGSRRMPNSLVCRSKGKRITSAAFGLLARTMTGLPYRDTQCGVKVLRKSAIDRVLPYLSEPGYLFDIDLLYAAKVTKCLVKEEGIIWADQAGSKVNVWRDSITMSLGLIRLKEKYKKIVSSPNYRKSHQKAQTELARL